MDVDAPERTRGHKKRARTRQQLIVAAADVIAERGEAFSVTDVVERAGVSNGTFYNYFEDRDDLVDQLVAELVADFTAGADAVVATDDPVLRFALISAMLLGQATRSSAVAHALLRLDVIQRSELDTALFGHLRRDLVDGVEAGGFTGSADAATIDVIAGALLMAARRLVAAGPDEDYQVSVIARLLQTLGVARRRAQTTATRAVAEATA